MTRKAIIITAMVVLVVTILSDSLLSQTQRAKPDSRAEAWLKRWEKQQAEREPPMKQAENQAYREALEATNMQWGVIKPRLRALLDLRQEARVAVMIQYAAWVTIPETSQADGGGISAGTSGTSAEQAARRYEDWSWKRPWQGKDKLTRAEQACEDLVSVLEKPNATDEEKRQKLNAMRQVKEQINKELQSTQQELRELLTPRQHARLVLIGVLD